MALSTRPWQWGLRARLLWTALFFREGRYSLADMAEHVLRSQRVREEELAGGRMLPDRPAVLRHVVDATRSVAGIGAEFGVFQGMTLRVLAAHSPPERRIFGFDSFEGLPEDWGDLLPRGTFETEKPRLDQHPNVELVVGLIEDTLPGFVEKHDPRFAFVHVDCDLYDTTRFILDAVLPRVEDGGVVVFDEYYGYPGYEQHEYRAWHEACAEPGFRAEPLAHSSHSAAFRIRRP